MVFEYVKRLCWNEILRRLINVKCIRNVVVVDQIGTGGLNVQGQTRFLVVSSVMPNQLVV